MTNVEQVQAEFNAGIEIYGEQFGAFDTRPRHSSAVWKPRGFSTQRAMVAARRA